MPKITYLDPEDTGTVNWFSKTFKPNQAVTVDADTDASLIAAAGHNSRFFKVTGLTGDDKEAADAADAEAKELAEREAAALRAEDEAAKAEADAKQAASDAVTQPGKTEAAQQPAQTKKPGGR